MEQLRIQKWLSSLGIMSRREVERCIQEGKIKVNGKVVADLGRKIDPETDVVAIDGKKVGVTGPSKVYWLFNKPDKTLTSHKSEAGKMSIFELQAFRGLSFRVVSAGRLDYRSEGLLILSNDGELIHRLMHPKYKVPRHYHVLINGKMTKEQLVAIKKGVELEDGPVKRIEVKYIFGQDLGQSAGSWYLVTVYEGRNRLVRRIFATFDKKVLRLVRIGFGELRLPPTLAPGKYSQLKPDQIRYLKRITDLLPE